MTDFPDSEKRQFVRIPVNVDVEYRFICQEDGAPISDQTFTGHTGNIGAGGFLLVGPVPAHDLISDLLMRRVVVVVTILLPDHQPIQALARAAWLEAVDQAHQTCSMGLTFKEITLAAQDELFRFIINAVSG